MVARDDATGTPDPVEKGFATLNTLRYVVLSVGKAILGIFDP